MLAADERAALSKYFATVELRQGQTLALPGDEITRVLFPHSGIVSFVVELSDGHALQTEMIGCDGVIGGWQPFDKAIFLNKVVVQTSGTASVIDRSALRDAVRAGSNIRRLLSAHEQLLLANIQQTAACNALHPVAARSCRWLLRMMDLIGAELAITQEHLAEMIGVRRTSITSVATRLQTEGLISYRRGRIHIDDAERLTQRE